MTELKDFDFAKTQALLGWAFRVCQESAQGINYQTVGGGNKKTTANEKALVVQEAARVVNFVDKKLTNVQRALVRFCFARTGDADHEQGQNYNLLHNFAWRQIVPPEDAEVCNGLSCLRVLAPYEIRMRVYGMKRAYSLQHLADFLEIPKTSFRRHYQNGWYGMVDALIHERAEAFSSVDEFLQCVLGRRAAQDRDNQVVAEIARYIRQQNASEALDGMWNRVSNG